MKKIIILFLIFFSTLTIANDNTFLSIDNGQVRIGQQHLDLSLKNFTIQLNNINYKTKAYFLAKSLKWIRSKNNIYTPQAQMRIIVNKLPAQTTPYLIFNDQTHIPTYLSHSNKYVFTLSVTLFTSTKIKVFLKEKLISTITIKAIPRPGIKSHHIDSSCTPFKLKIKNFNNQYLSLTCKLSRLGHLGHEYPKLDIYWATPNFYVPNPHAHFPYITSFTHTGSSSITLVDNQGNKKQLKLYATLPRKLHRIKTALGIGPYQFKTTKLGTPEQNATIPDITLYGKIDLTLSSSFRFFNSFAQKKESLFNNFGLYFAYDLANIYNNNIKVVALLGMQHITFKHLNNTNKVTQYITPQGAEITFRHPFGLKNYLLGGGAFFSVKESIRYTNSWIRFGKKFMIELNYIEWGYNNNYAQTYGLSLVFPLISFF